jgi:sulfoxide reductase catalytic subunit YedY
MGESQDNLTTPAAGKTQTVHESFRNELVKKERDVVDEDWAGGVPPQFGIAPRIRVGKNKWFNLLWLIPI